jgi:hypothetical protein
MPSLIDSGRIVRPGTDVEPQFSVKESASGCGFTTLPLSLRQFLSTPTPGCPHPECVRLHIKVLQAPTPSQNTIGFSLKSMQLVYNTAGIRVEVGSREDFEGDPAFATLLNVNVGPCVASQSLTSGQAQLFANSNFVGPNDIAVYYVNSVTRTTILSSGVTVSGPLNGCSAPTTARSAIIAAPVASRWTLAHEVAHILGCVHVTGESCGPTFNPTVLMTGCSTSTIAGHATLSSSEVSAVQNSSLSQPC